jgi:hypothetical protein
LSPSPDWFEGKREEVLLVSTTTLPDQMEPSLLLAGMATGRSTQVYKSEEVV